MANDESGNKGIYSNRLNFFGDGNSNFDVDNPNNTFSVNRPTLVAEVGQNIDVDGLVGTVEDLNIYDPVNNRDRGDIAFWVDTTGGEGVVRARPQEVIYLDFNPVGNFSAGFDPGADALFNELGVPLTWSGNINTVFSQFAPNRTDLDSIDIQTRITTQVQQAFTDALTNVKVLSSLSGNSAPTDGRFTRVYIGDSPYGATSLGNNKNGIATAADLFNQDFYEGKDNNGNTVISFLNNDAALVFVDNIFRPFGNFKDSSGQPVGLNKTGNGIITDQEVVNAISTTVLHEVGHTLGLLHLDDALSDLLMDEYSGQDPLTGLDELRKIQSFGDTDNALAEISGIKQNDKERLAFTVGSDDSSITRKPPVSAIVNLGYRNKFSLGASLNAASINVAQAAIGIVPLGEFHALPEFIDLGSGDLATLLDIDINVTSEDKIILVASTDGNGIDIVGVPANSGIDVSSIDLSNGLFVATNENLRSDIYNESGQPIASSIDLFQITPSGVVQIGTVGSEDAPPPTNTPPQPINDSTTTNEDTTVEIDVLSNDTDAENNPLTLSINQTATNGTATVNDNGTPSDPTDDKITYTPNSNFNGTDSFTYTVSDGTDSTSATVDITVNPINDLPVAANDTAETNQDQLLTILPSDLLSNDSDVDGDELTITEVSNSANGTVQLGADGNILFTPDSDFNGLASFEYTVSDGTENTNATVAVTVNPVNDLPIATNDTVETNEDQPLTIFPSDLLINDSDIDGDSLTITEVSNSANGTVELDTDGNVLFTPDSDFNGLASFEYTVSDGTETTNATVEVTVNPVNDLPVATNDTAETNEDQPLTILPSDLLSNDSDIDGDNLTITEVSNSANGTVELNNDGNILFTPDNDFNGLASFEYTVTDGTDTTSATVEITVNPVNDTNIINGTTGRDSLLGTDSNDIITGFQGADRITTGNGQDKLVYNSIVDAGDFITDFDPLNDIIDLQGVLQSVGFSGSNAIDDGYVQLVSYGSRGTSLQIDTDGSDGSAIFRPYLFLQGVSATVINDNPNSLTFS